MNHDAAWYEHQYNPRMTVSNASAILDGWRKRSMLLRNALSPMTDFKYGSHPRENIDLFRASGAEATLVFIHGGYFRSLSKLETSFIVEPYVARGITVALVNYPLCPDVAVGDIRDSVIRAFSFMCQKLLTRDEQRTIVVSGHSAGGHLAALHATVDWQERGLAADPIKAIVSLSGVFDLEPLIHTSINADIRLNTQTAQALNLLAAVPKTNTRMLLAVGGDEPDEFERQSQDLAKSWSGLTTRYEKVTAANHFTIVEHFANPATALHQSVMSLLVS
jgi:arylformamidase